MAKTAEDEAREVAEARRQKILEEASDRMSLVEGTQQATAPSSESTSRASARMAAMRKLRFKSKSAEPKKDGAAVAEALQFAESISKDSKVEEPESIASAVEEIGPKLSEDTSTPLSVTNSETATIETKKKYQGVAKMRRRMVIERHQQQQQEESTTATSKDMSTEKAVKILKKAKPILPLVMHVVTVLLLFLAGMDIGLQQQTLQEVSFVTVHTQLAPREQMGGLALWKQVTLWSEESKAHRDLLVGEEWQEEIPVLEENDEFATDDLETLSNENLDPLFGVDLDRLTRGPGFVLWMARGAVRFHRLNLAIFLYGPRRFFLGLIDWVYSLTTSPPVLCLLAILIRQVIGKVVLGAELPKILDDPTQHKDVLSMVRTFITNFVLKAFPTATMLYEVFVHVRSDMYVLLCGVFVGMAYSHRFGTSLVEDLNINVITDLHDYDVNDQEIHPNAGQSDEL